MDEQQLRAAALALPVDSSKRQRIGTLLARHRELQTQAKQALVDAQRVLRERPETDDAFTLRSTVNGQVF